MKRIEEIDKNMAVVTRLTDTDIEWYDVHEAPFALHGFNEPQEKDQPFRRLPEDVAEATNPGVATLALNTAGGRVRFITDSPYVAIHVEMKELSPMDHMAFTGIFGFDLYVRVDGRETYKGTFRPSTSMIPGYESKLALPEGGPHEVTINFPLYNRVDRLFVGLKENSCVSAPNPYKYSVPVVYYGSSITQGGCASRPGNSYQAMISRALDCDYINLGFSGSAKGEDAIVEYMSNMKMSVFVCDYDHNAPTVEHLRNTHEKLYRAVRAKQPDLPIIFVTKPDTHQPDTFERREVIRATYEKAVAEGDQNVAFINGGELFAGENYDDCTVDLCHPNDLGFYRMAQGIGAEVKKWL